MALLALSVAWLIGAGAALAWPLWSNSGSLLALGLSALVAAALAWPSPRLRLLALALACCFLGSSRSTAALERLEHDPLASLHGEVELIGIVEAPPERRGQRTSLTLDLQARLEDGAWQPQRGRLWLQTYGGPALAYGDVLLARGRLARPAARPGYPLPTLLQRQGINHLLERPRLTLVERRPGDPLGATLQGWREGIGRAIRQNLPAPHASLLAGVLVGTRADMPPDLRQALVATGTSHIVAVSGFNVAIVAGLASAALGRVLGRRFALAPALLLITLYTLLTGPQPSAVRAAIMGGAAVVALGVGRLSDPLAALAAAGAIMLAVEPLQGLDLGFQLSFAATAGLILLQPILAPRLAWLPRPVRDPLAMTLAAQLATLPLLASTFHTVSLISPLVNLAIGPALPVVMGLGALLVVATPVPQVASLLAWPAWATLAYVESAIRLAASWPGAIVPLGTLPPGLAVALYAAVALLCLAGLPESRALLARLSPTGRGAMAVGAALVAVLAATAALATARPDGRLHVQSMDLGPSLALLARSPSGRVLALFASPPTPGLAASLAEHLAPLDSRLDVLAVPDAAAAARATSLLSYFPARLVVLPATGQARASPARVGSVALREGEWVAVDTGLQLAPLLADSGEGQRLVAWRLRYGLLDLTLASGEGEWPWPMAGDATSVLVLADAPRGAVLSRPQGEAGTFPLLAIAPAEAEWPSGATRTGLALSIALQGDVALSSDGRLLRVHSAGCAPPLSPPGCEVELALGE